jgi:putative methyltransferase (TIGR04325 family)
MSWNSIFRIALARTPIGTALGRIPLLEKRYVRHAMQRVNHAGLFTGVYESRLAAERDIPDDRNHGWDNEQAAQMWLGQIDRMQPTAYAPFFWLSKLMREGTTIVDYGGSIGLSYYSYVRRQRLPAGVRWSVVELPHLAAAGKKIALRENAAQLEFVTDLASAPACEILLCAGTLQYIEDSVPGVLEKLRALPRHILLNKLPLTKGQAYWTLQNFGPAISPYRVFNEAEFLGSLQQAGYALRDRWEVPELACDVPFHPRHCVPQFSGLYFEKA